VLLAVTAAGDLLPPLIIHSHQVPSLNAAKSNQQSIANAHARHRVITKNEIMIGESTYVYYTAENPSAWINTHLMCTWTTQVLAPHVKEIDMKHRGNDASDTTLVEETKPVLYLDNMSAHTAPEVRRDAKSVGIRMRFLPANTTSHLQPMDYSLNATFKCKIRDLWKRWFKEQCNLGAEAKTKHGNFKIVKKEVFNEWVMTAWAEMKREGVAACFAHTLTGIKQRDCAIEHLKSKPEVIIPPPRNRKQTTDCTDDGKDGEHADDGDQLDDDQLEEDVEHLVDATWMMNELGAEEEITAELASTQSNKNNATRPSVKRKSKKPQTTNTSDSSSRTNVTTAKPKSKKRKVSSDSASCEPVPKKTKAVKKAASPKRKRPDPVDSDDELISTSIKKNKI
jgi:hypothetical protein